MRTARVRLLLALAFTLALSLAACGSNTPPAPSASSRPTVAPGATSASTTQSPSRTSTPGSTPLPGATATPITPPGPTPTPVPGQTGTPDGENLLPTPTTTDVVLLVSSPSALSEREQTWLTDLRAQLGNVATLAYRDTTLDALRAYFVVFVIDQSSELDPAILAEAYRAGLTIHLIGAAAQYQAQVSATSAP
jgi:hypothetical protein